ncbi:MAG: hypothetical protein ACYDAQ_20720 [Mycobacteriales bacterium]
MSGWAARLRALDDRALPPLGARLLRAAERAGRLATRTAQWVDEVRQRPGGPPRRLRDLPGRLRQYPPSRQALDRLDDRFAGRGLLAVLRDVPQVGFIVIAMLLVAGAAGSAIDHSQSSAAPGAAVSESCGLAYAVAGSAYVGPPVGTLLASYVAARTALLLRCALAHPDQQVLAVVSLQAPVTPDAAAGIFGPLPLSRVYLQVPGHPARSYDVTGPAPQAVTIADTVTATELAADAALQQQQADTVTGTDPTEVQGKAFLLMIARHERAEAAELRAGCACLYGAVLTSSLAELRALAGAGQVRLVDPAPLGTTLSAGTLLPLLPSDTGVATPEPVPAPFTAGGP